MVKIKVCGMRNAENISSLLALKPDFVGFIFYDKSKRFVKDFPQIKFPSTIKKIGVFVNETIEEILIKVHTCELDGIQLHGHESVEYCKNISRALKSNVGSLRAQSEFCHIEIIKAFSVSDDFDFSTTDEYQEDCDYLLFDTKGKDYGGNGLKFNWEILKQYKGNTPYFLSGGIGLEDENELLSFLRRPESNRCHVIDVNSRFEDSPGLKNIEKLKEFKSNLR